MRYLLLAILGYLFCSCESSNEFVLQGNFPAEKGQVLVKTLDSLGYNRIVAKTEIKDHQFQVKLNAEYPTIALLQCNEMKAYIVIEPGSYTFHVTEQEGCMDYEYKGGTYYSQGSDYGEEYKALRKQADEIEKLADQKEAAGEMNIDQIDSLYLKANDLLKKAKLQKKQYIQNVLENSTDDSQRIICALFNRVWKKKGEIIPNLCNMKSKAHYAGELAYLSAKKAKLDLEERLRNAKVQVGQKFKNIAALDENGKAIDLSQVVKKNQLVYLDFWASWCGPCVDEIPNLKKLYKQYHSKGLEIYSISKDGKEGFAKAVKKYKLPWIKTYESKMESAIYNVQSLPSSYLIDSEGEIISASLRGKELEEMLKSFFQ